MSYPSTNLHPSLTSRTVPEGTEIKARDGVREDAVASSTPTSSPRITIVEIKERLHLHASRARPSRKARRERRSGRTLTSHRHRRAGEHLSSHTQHTRPQVHIPCSHWLDLRSHLHGCPASPRTCRSSAATRAVERVKAQADSNILPQLATILVDISTLGRSRARPGSPFHLPFHSLSRNGMDARHKAGHDASGMDLAPA